MTDLQTETAELPSFAEGQNAFDRRAAFRSIAQSFVINGLCPYLLFRYLEPKYPDGSLLPLLYASVFPVIGLLYGIVRKRTVDFIAIIALFEITVNVTATLLASNIRWALVARSTTGLLTATAFLTSALIGKPIIYYIARQFVAGGDRERQERFAAVTAAEGGRTFYITTLIWAVAIYSLSAIHITMALTLRPDTYLLAAQVVGMTVNIGMIVWTINFSRTRLLRVLSPATAPA